METLDVQFYRDDEGYLVVSILNDVRVPIYVVTVETAEDWLAVMESIKEWVGYFKV